MSTAKGHYQLDSEAAPFVCCGMGIIALLIVVGLVLLFLETILPGLIAGALGLLALGAAVVYAYMDLGTRAGNMTFALVLLLLCLGTVLWVKFFQRVLLPKSLYRNARLGTSARKSRNFWVKLASHSRSYAPPAAA
jgi:membrane protein implicated in regulation of membrane protease activity